MAKHVISASHVLLPLTLFALFGSTLQLPTSDSPFPKYRQPQFVGKFARRGVNAATATNKLKYHYQVRYFEQDLDHFSFSSTPLTYQQRYLINTDSWWGPTGGPIFFYCGNEGDIEWFAANTGFMWEIAPKFGAMVVFPEHRYYGESMPFGSGEEAYKNSSTLSFLTAEQALADFAVLLTDLKRNLSAESSPVVLFGGSYGGMLAAWMRLKYPHIAVGALASSAPILQFEDLVPSSTFYDLVSRDFKRESVSCFDTIKQSWDALVSEGQKENGLSEMSKTFHLCRELKDIQALVDWLFSAYSYLAMVDYPYPSDFLMPLPGNPIREVCKKIDGATNGTSIVERIFKGVSIYYNYTGEAKCFQLDDDPHGMDGWNWQACTEMVMPMSCSEDKSMFPPSDFSLSAFEDSCKTAYNVKPKPRWITTEFGGHNFKNTLRKFGSNMIFSNGLLDPWSGGGVLQNVSESVIALVTKEGAHHIDLRASTPEDPDWLLEQRATEVELIKGWLNEYYDAKKMNTSPLTSSAVFTM